MTAALILAAGGVPENHMIRPTGEMGGTSAIRRLIAVFRRADVERIVVVTGYDAESVEKHCAHMGVVFLRNERFESGDMLSSVKIGLEYLKGKCARAFITPADVPLFSPETVTAIANAGDAQAAIPICGVTTGHPLLVSECIFEHILSYNGTGGLEGALTSGDISRRLVEVSDEGVIFDFSRHDVVTNVILKQFDLRISPGIKVWLAGGRGFFGPGVFQLLTLTKESGSLKIACRQCGVSYSKAWKVIANIEAQLGYKIIESRQGGKYGGSTEITESGMELLQRYGEYEKECRELVREAFERHFGGFF